MSNDRPAMSADRRKRAAAKGNITHCMTSAVMTELVRYMLVRLHGLSDTLTRRSVTMSADGQTSSSLSLNYVSYKACTYVCEYGCLPQPLTMIC